ncbi:Polyketide transporter ATPase component [Paucilactobacillus vaccinostercus DSM 20634]|uniref:Polyketide transporter ATPase component n=2 Tax=Paucilactobacillus vaccinostercus TaxID=176291 RepID=A0A0R2AE04_9LACO|nr:Polyketide transporter ATPase component [Paucilactobacillus vaccinostercus DSM 20634]
MVMNQMVNTVHLTKDYKKNRGIFDMNLQIKQGEVVGIVGKNGAGKTTTMRTLMGFIHPTDGYSEIRGLNSWSQASKTKRMIGYVPGEIAFPDTKSGETFLNNQLKLLRASKDTYVNDLIQRFKIDLTADIKRMSKGMKQKTALVCAFMTKAPLLLLDEPTTGLDPVMRDAFIDLVLKVKANGTTVFLSSHMFNELERTCDRILFLKDGKVIDVVDQNKFETIHSFQKVKIQTSTSEGFQKILTSFSETSHVNSENHEITVLISNTKVATLLVLLQDIEIDDISFDTQTLDNYFEKELQVK